MKLFAFFMVLVFLFVGVLGFGSINEFEAVGIVDALNIDAVSADEILLDSVAPQETTGLELLDVQAMIAVTGFNDYLRMALSFTYFINDLDTLSIRVTSQFICISKNTRHGWGSQNRYILSGPYGGEVIIADIE